MGKILGALGVWIKVVQHFVILKQIRISSLNFVMVASLPLEYKDVFVKL
jgi:hypothetical protein